MGKKHQRFAAAVEKSRAEAGIREAQARTENAERQRGLLSSYLGTEDQVAGTGAFSGDQSKIEPYSYRYQADTQALNQLANFAVKGETNRWQRGGNVEYANSVVSQANDHLQLAEDAARRGDFKAAAESKATAEAYMAQQQNAYGSNQNIANLITLRQDPEAAARARASTVEGQIVGRNLLKAKELQDPNSAEYQRTRGLLLDPSTEIIKANETAAERAIASERSEMERQIRNQAGASGIGFSPAQQMAQRAAVANDAARARAEAYTTTGAQRAALTLQVNQFMQNFTEAFATNSVGFANAWVDGRAGVRDTYVAGINEIQAAGVQLADSWAKTFYADYQQLREQDKAKKALRREMVPGILTGTLAAASIFGGTENLGSSSGQKAGSGTTAVSTGGGGAGFSGGNSFFSGTTGTAKPGTATGGGAAEGAAGALGGGKSSGSGIGNAIGSIAAFFA